MKKIMSKEEKERIERRKQIVIGIVMVIVLILSIIGYAFLNPSHNVQKIKYNNIDFIFSDGSWYFKFENKVFSVSYNPHDIENISTEINKEIDDYFGKPLYFYYQNDKEAEQEIVRNLYDYVERINYACFPGDNCNWAEKNCSNNMIIIKEINETMIKQEDNCIYIFYKEGENLKAVDAFLYKILGII